MPSETQKTGALHIAVVGAGILGLAVATRLAEQGARITLIDEHAPVSGTSSTSFAWVNSNGKQPRSYHDLNSAGLKEHLSWQAGLPVQFRWFHQTGAYEWVEEDESEALELRVQELGDIGYAASFEDASHARECNPGLRVPDGQIAWFAEEGYVDISRFAAWALLRLREAGATLRFRQRVLKTGREHGQLRLDLDGGERVFADRIVLAAGRWTRSLLADFGYDFAAPEALDPTPRVRSILAYTRPLPVQVGSLLFAPGLNVRPDGGGRLVLQSLQLDELLGSESDLSPMGAIAREFQRRLAHLLPCFTPDPIQELRIGRRSLTDDSLPAIGWLEDKIYLVATHSGVTLAPTLSRLAAEEIVLEQPQTGLEPFRPQRLMSRRTKSRSGELRPPSSQ